MGAVASSIKVCRKLILAAVCLCPVVLTACRGPTYYQWGRYEPSIGAMYDHADAEPDKKAEILDKQIQLLAKEIDETVRTGRRVPPGKRAHLAYLCYLAGDRDKTVKYLEAEKEAFSESAHFIDKVLRSTR